MLTLEEIDNIPFLFIVGRGRSGTTMLQTLMDAHPNTILPLESRIIIFLKKKYAPITNWTDALVNDFINDLYKEKKFKLLWNINQENLRKAISLYDIKKLSFQLLCKIIYLNYNSPFKKEKIVLIGDKNPIYSIFIKELLEVFPNALFIHIIRDYRDNIVSNRKSFGWQGIPVLAQGWKNYNIVIDRIKEQMPDRFYTIRYEDLVTKPQVHIPEICDFLSINFYLDMLNSYKKVNEIYEQTKSKSILHLFSNMLNPINTTQIDKWKLHLTVSEIEMAEYIAGEYAIKYGYKTTVNSRKIRCFLLSITGKLNYRLRNRIIKLYYRIPFGVRDLITTFSDKLFKWIHVSHYYNRNDIDPVFKENK